MLSQLARHKEQADYFLSVIIHHCIERHESRKKPKSLFIFSFISGSYFNNSHNVLCKSTGYRAYYSCTAKCLDSRKLSDNSILFAIRETPRESIMVTIAGSPSGIAATAKLTDV